MDYRTDCGDVARSQTLSHNQRPVDFYDHLLIVLLWRSLPKAANAIAQDAAVAAAHNSRIGEPQHHLHVRVAQPYKELLWRRYSEEAELRLDPPEPPSTVGTEPSKLDPVLPPSRSIEAHIPSFSRPEGSQSSEHAHTLYLHRLSP